VFSNYVMTNTTTFSLFHRWRQSITVHAALLSLGRQHEMRYLHHYATTNSLPCHFVASWKLNYTLEHIIHTSTLVTVITVSRCRRFWHATHDCVAPYVDIILHRERFWAKSAALGSVRWWRFRSCWMVLSHVMRGRPSCLLQSPGGEANRILLASALWSGRT